MVRYSLSIKRFFQLLAVDSKFFKLVLSAVFAEVFGGTFSAVVPVAVTDRKNGYFFPTIFTHPFLAFRRLEFLEFQNGLLHSTIDQFHCLRSVPTEMAFVDHVAWDQLVNLPETFDQLIHLIHR